MALGIVSDEEFEKELSKVVEIKHGRGNKPEIPQEIRKIIAEESINGEAAKDIADKYAVSPSSISAYKHGSTSTASYNEPNQELSKRNDEIRAQIIGTARSRLFEALNQITPEKLKYAKLRDVASVAKDMSAVIRDTSPTITTNNMNAQFVFHVPKARDEKDYDIVEVSQ
jgi:hypothetical protein